MAKLKFKAYITYYFAEGPKAIALSLGSSYYNGNYNNYFTGLV